MAGILYRPTLQGGCPGQTIWQALLIDITTQISRGYGLEINSELCDDI